MATTFEGLGQGDTNGAWLDANGVYASAINYTPIFPFAPASPPPSVSGIVPPLFAAFLGLAWLKNIVCLTRDTWDESLTTPYSGQLFPVPNTGGTQTGQIYPY